MAGSEKIYYDSYLVNFSSSNSYPTIWVNGRNTLLHRYVWEKYNGEIPEGYVIHHKDRNKRNYDISNLELKKVSDHHRDHAIENGLGKGNKGKLKLHSSGFCKGATPVILIKDDEVKRFDSVTLASKFLGVKKAGGVSRVLTGKRKTVKGWRCYYA
jgi:hypothetical protein